METDDNSLSGTFADTIDKPSYNPGNGPLFVNRNPRNSAGQPYFNPKLLRDRTGWAGRKRHAPVL